MQLWMWTFGMEYWGSSIQVWMDGQVLIICGLRCGIKRQMEFDKRWVNNFIKPRATPRTPPPAKKKKKEREREREKGEREEEKKPIVLENSNIRNVNWAQWKPFPHFNSLMPRSMHSSGLVQDAVEILHGYPRGGHSRCNLSQSRDISVQVFFFFFSWPFDNKSN